MASLEDELAADMLRGADEIALYIYGDREQRRKIYHLAATSRLPIFKLGSMICARRSVLLQWVQHQEERHCIPRSEQTVRSGNLSNDEQNQLTFEFK